MERPKKYFISQFRSVDPFLADRYPPAGHRFTVGRSRAKRDAKASSAGGLLVRGSPNPAVEHVCNTTRTPASGEKHTRFHPERERERALRSTLASKLSPRVFLSLRIPLSLSGAAGGSVPCPEHYARPISKRSAASRPGMPFPFGDPLEPVAHSSAIRRLIDSWEGGKREQLCYTLLCRVCKFCDIVYRREFYYFFLFLFFDLDFH